MEKVVRGLQCCSGVMVEDMRNERSAGLTMDLSSDLNVVGPLTMSIYECMIMSSMTASDMLY